HVAPILTPVAVALGVEQRALGWAALERRSRLLYYVEVSAKAPGNARPDLSKVLARLQRVVSAPFFVPWLFLASRGRAQLLYLHPHGEQLGELRRWTMRHPLVGTLPREFSDQPCAVEVPVRVEKL